MPLPARTSGVGAAALALALALSACSSGSSNAPADAGPPDDPLKPVFLLTPSEVVHGKERFPAALEKLGHGYGPLYYHYHDFIEAWEEAHPGKRYSGTPLLDVQAGATCQQALNAMSALFVDPGRIESISIRAGVPKVDLKVSRKPDDSPLRKGRVAHFAFHEDGTVDLKPTRCLAPYDTVPVGGLARLVRAWCDGPSCVNDIQVTCDANTTFDKILVALQDIKNMSSQMRLVLADPTCPKLDQPRLRPGPDGNEGVVEEHSVPWTPPQLDPAQKYPGGRVVTKIVNSTGGLDKPAVEAAIKGRADDFMACYMTGLKDQRDARGRVRLRAEVNKKGAVIQVHDVPYDAIPSTLIRSCMAFTLASTTFPAAQSYPADVFIDMDLTPTGTLVQPPAKK